MRLFGQKSWFKIKLHRICVQFYAKLFTKAFIFRRWREPKSQSAENRKKSVTPILVTLMSRSDSDAESSNVSLKENNVQKNEGKILWFSAD